MLVGASTAQATCTQCTHILSSIPYCYVIGTVWKSRPRWENEMKLALNKRIDTVCVGFRDSVKGLLPGYCQQDDG